jgi:hypothetical protein
MKKFIFALLLIIPLLSSAQDDIYYGATGPKEKTAGNYLIKSAQMQYASIFLYVGATAITWYGIKSAAETYPTNPIREDELKNQYLLIGYVFGGAAIVCHFASIQYKLKAGKMLNKQTSLNAYISPTGATLALKF